MFKILKTLLPCPKRKAIAILALKTGHTSRFCREELVSLLIDSGDLVLDENDVLSIGIDHDGEYPTDKHGNHIRDDTEPSKDREE